MVLQYKGLPFKLTPVGPDAKVRVQHPGADCSQPYVYTQEPPLSALCGARVASHLTLMLYGSGDVDDRMHSGRFIVRLSRSQQTNADIQQELLNSSPPRLPTTIMAVPVQPDWLVEDYEGQLPCLVDSKEAYTESANVVDYIEYFYPEPTLSIKDSDAVAKVGDELRQGQPGVECRCPC